MRAKRRCHLQSAQLTHPNDVQGPPTPPTPLSPRPRLLLQRAFTLTPQRLATCCCEQQQNKHHKVHFIPKILFPAKSKSKRLTLSTTVGSNLQLLADNFSAGNLCHFSSIFCLSNHIYCPSHSLNVNICLSTDLFILSVLPVLSVTLNCH